MPTIKAGAINLNYEIYDTTEPLLLIMGFGMPGAAWLPTLPLMPGFKCIYFDNRGTGYSDKPAGPYTVAQMAEDAAALLDSLNVAKAKVYGVSMGGMIAQELAIRHPAKVARLVLGCTTPGGPHAKQAAPEVIVKLLEGSTMMESDPDKAFDIIMPILYPPKFAAEHPELKQLMIMSAKMMPPTPRETIERTAAGVAEFNAYDRLDRIKCPVLIVHGDSDVLVPAANAAILKERIPHAEVFMIANAGHAFQAADPVGIHARITNWLRG